MQSNEGTDSQGKTCYFMAESLNFEIQQNYYAQNALRNNQTKHL